MNRMRNRTPLCILGLLLAVLAVAGCRKKAAATVPKPAPVTEPAPPPAIIPVTPSLPGADPVSSAALPKTAPMPNYFESAERSFQSGEYRKATQAYETFLQSNPKSKNGDQALFHLGLSRVMADDAARDWRQAEAAFHRLIAEYPQSPYRSQAEWILGLQGQIEKLRVDIKERDERIRRLSEELRKLKAIDMQRRPSRPKE